MQTTNKIGHMCTQHMSQGVLKPDNSAQKSHYTQESYCTQKIVSMIQRPSKEYAYGG